MTNFNSEQQMQLRALALLLSWQANPTHPLLYYQALSSKANSLCLIKISQVKKKDNLIMKNPFSSKFFLCLKKEQHHTVKAVIFKGLIPIPPPPTAHNHL